MRGWWRDRAFECPVCGWQGMREPPAPGDDAICPECGSNMYARTWSDTWGRTLVILAVVVAAVLFVAYFGQSQ
ncbi:MAG TPA: hypothetical protein VFE62_09085 [Gemmataceae bacterium]|nr:hypothetical protein [Gemmataceae bacterium]